MVAKPENVRGLDEPTGFTNLAPGDVPKPNPNVFSNQQLRNVKYQNDLAYVVLENGTLVVGKHGSNGQGHIDLSGGKTVLAAGTVDIKDGKVIRMDNDSGHYKPSGSNARAVAERAFANSGLGGFGTYTEGGF